jgi:hypothetical protein
MTTATRPRRSHSNSRTGYASHTSGANALRIDFDDVFDVEPDEPFAPPSKATKTRAKATKTRAKATKTPAEATKTRAVPERRIRRNKRAAWVSDVTQPAAAPAPLPIALPRAPFLLLMVGLVVVGVLGVLVLNTRINENSFRLNDLKANQASLDLQEQQLQRNLADLESPGNLRAAATRLGLVPAGTPAFINLPDGRVVGIPQPAAGR